MIKNEYILKVDLKKKHTAVTPTFVQYDEAVLRFLISDNGKPFFFSGQTSIKTYHRRKDGIVVEGDARVEVVKGIQQIVYEYSGNEMYQLGYVDTSLVIYSGNKKVSIQPFKVLIVDSIYDDIATPSNPEYGALQNIIASVETLVEKVNATITEANKAISNANEAIDNANNAADNVQTTISEWKYADTYSHTTNYKKNNVVSYNGSTFIAIRDTKGNYPIGNLSDANWRIMALKGQDGVVVLNKEDFKAALNQTDFTLPLEYDQHQGRVRVIVDGVEQFTPDNFVELSSTKIRMNSGLRKDADVKVIYFGNAPALKNDIQLQIDNINDLLEHFNLAEANTAITHATTQGNYAKAKGDAANTATTQANTARDSANSAASSANTAATNANIAKDATVIATNKANTATALVESATSNANTATTNAISAANDANMAKNNANQAAVSANDAVANMSPKGEYSPTTNYLPRNIVSYLGSSYMNIVASRGVLPTVTANWQPVGSKGDKGDTGFGFTWKQEYNPNSSYVRDDVVYYNGSSYIALKSVTGVNPSNDNINWNIITQRGLDGMGSVSSVNGVNPDLEGNVTISTVTSVNGETGVIAGLETVTNSNNKLSNKVDKVAGKQLSAEDYTTAEKTKLSGIATNANNYAHPANHSPSIITQDANNRFVTDTEKAAWNAKETTTDSQAKVDVHANKTNNPHQVTASQVGAYTKEEVDNKTGILSDNIGDMRSLETANTTDLVKAINEVNAKPTGGDTTEIAKQINTLYKLSTGIIREQVYTKLLQEASSRLEGGTVFAHDMNGNIIGMTLDEANSQNIVIRDGKMMMLAKSEVTKTVTDATVVASAYDTSGNGGRKLVRLRNGWLVAIIKSPTGAMFYKSIDNGLNWGTGVNIGYSASDVALVTNGTKLYLLWSYNTEFRVSVYSDNLVPLFTTKVIDTSQTALGNVSLAINPEGTELHAAWASKSPTYPNSFNIRYAKGVISQVDGSVTWGTVEQITADNVAGNNTEYPSILINGNGNPCILVAEKAGSNYQIVARYYTGSSWTSKVVYFAVAYVQSSPSAIFVPKSVNGLANGRIWVAWHGMDVTDTVRNNIKVSYSDDGGVTWSAMQRLTSGNTYHQTNPSITVNKNNETFIVYENNVNSYMGIYKIENKVGTWSAPIEVKDNTTHNMNYPATLVDTSLAFSEPLLIYKDNVKVGFYGTWKESVETPTLTAKAVYDIPSTDFVGAFVKKIGATNVQAYVNDVIADAELVDNEYQFVKQLDAEVPVKLRLELSRANVSGGESDNISRVLGGRS